MRINVREKLSLKFFYIKLYKALEKGYMFLKEQVDNFNDALVGYFVYFQNVIG